MLLLPFMNVDTVTLLDIRAQNLRTNINLCTNLKSVLKVLMVVLQSVLLDF